MREATPFRALQCVCKAPLTLSVCCVCVCVSAPIYRTVRYPHETVTHALWDAPKPSQMHARPIACRIHGSACQVVRVEKHPHTRQTHKGASTPQTAACKAKPTPQATQQAPTISNSTATHQGKQGPPPHRSIRALPVWGHKIKQAHRAVQALNPHCHPNPIPMMPMSPS